MAPPTRYARLNAIDPEQLGQAVSSAVRGHVSRLAMDVGLSVREDGVDNLRLSVRDLAHYARTGQGMDASVEEYLISIAPPVWMRAYDPGAYQTPEFDAGDPDSLQPDWRGQLVLVMRAAIAREKLDRKQPIAPAELAALASMAAAAVRLLCQKGEIVAERSEDGWTILPKDAKAFLKARATK